MKHFDPTLCWVKTSKSWSSSRATTVKNIRRILDALNLSPLMRLPPKMSQRTRWLTHSNWPITPSRLLTCILKICFVDNSCKFQVFEIIFFLEIADKIIISYLAWKKKFFLAKIIPWRSTVTEGKAKWLLQWMKCPLSVKTTLISLPDECKSSSYFILGNAS